MPPKKPLVTSCDHTGVTVVDLERSLSFWTDIIGLKLVERSHPIGAEPGAISGVGPYAEIKIAKVEAPNGYVIELMQYISPPGKHYTPRPCDVGSLHLAFTVDNLDFVLETVLAAGCVMHGAPVPFENGRLVYVHDFDGVAIEFIERPSRF